MSNSANQLGGKCPHMPYLDRGQMSAGGGGGGGGGGGETCPTLETLLSCSLCYCDIKLVSLK